MLFSLLWLATGTASAQHMLGLAYSNYAGIHGLYLNPSTLADHRLAFSLHLSSAEVNFSNSLLWYDGDVSLFKLIRGEQELEEDYFREVPHLRSKMFTASVDYRGPSVMLRLGAKSGLGLTTRVRGALHGNHIADSLARFLVNDQEALEAQAQASGDNQGNFQANLMAEVGLTYAHVVLDQGRHRIKTGITFKRAAGLYAAHLVSRDFRFVATETPSPTVPDSTEVVLDIESIDATYGYVSEDHVNNLTAAQIPRLWGRAPGTGWGVDIGFTYEYRQPADQQRARKVTEDDRYRYRLGVSLTDLGGIRYDDPTAVDQATIAAKDKTLRLDDFDKAESTSDYGEMLKDALDIPDSDFQHAFITGLPAMLHVNLDYRFSRSFYVNAAVSHNLRGTYAVSMRQPSVAALIPRLETKVFEIALPLSLYNNYRQFGVGAMLKLAGFYVGSDQLGGFFQAGKLYGAHVYAGVSVLNIARKKNPPNKNR